MRGFGFVLTGQSGSAANTTIFRQLLMQNLRKLGSFFCCCFILHSASLFWYVLKSYTAKKCLICDFYIQAKCVVNQSTFYNSEAIIFPMVLTFWAFEKPWAAHDKVWCPVFGVQEPPPLLESCGTPLEKRGRAPRSHLLHLPLSLQPPPQHSAAPSVCLPIATALFKTIQSNPWFYSLRCSEI